MVERAHQALGRCWCGDCHSMGEAINLNTIVRRDCCGSPINEEHYVYCDVGVNVGKVNESLTRDVERWDDSYREHNTESIRHKVTTAQNGYSPQYMR